MQWSQFFFENQKLVYVLDRMVLPDLAELARDVNRSKRNGHSLIASFITIASIDASFLKNSTADSIPDKAKECWLVAKYGLESVINARMLFQSISDACRTESQYRRLIDTEDNIVEIANIMPENFSYTLSFKHRNYSILLTPPTKVCLECNLPLVSNHETKVMTQYYSY